MYKAFTQSVQAVRGEQNDHKRVNAGKQQPGAKKSLYAKKRGIRFNYFKTGPGVQYIRKIQKYNFQKNVVILKILVIYIWSLSTLR